MSIEMKLIHLTFIVTWNIQGPDLGIGSCLPLIKMGEDKLLWQRFFRRLLDPFSLSLVSSSLSDQVQKLTATKFTLTHVVTDWRKAMVFTDLCSLQHHLVFSAIGTGSAGRTLLPVIEGEHRLGIVRGRRPVHPASVDHVSHPVDDVAHPGKHGV